MMSEDTKKQELIDKLAAREELFRRRAIAGDFYSYCLYHDYPFFTKRKVLKQVIDTFQKVHDSYRDGIVIKVAISLPPRSGKSYLTSLFCSFMLGRYPKQSVMRNSCTSTLYEELSKATLDMVASEKWQALFKINEFKRKSVEKWSLKTAKMNSYFGGGTGGTIIGSGATMLAISDDLYKNMEDAMSDTINDSVISWADSTASSRTEKGCCFIDIGTRWRSRDLIGTREARGNYDVVIRVPAIIDGKTFCEEVNTTEHYLELKRDIAEEIWSAEYMQEPVDIKGRLFNKEEMQYFNLSDIEEVDYDANIGICDTADEGTDYLSAPMFKKIGKKYYLYDVVFTREKMELTQPLLVGTINVNRVSRMRFESNGGGKLFAVNVSKECENTYIDWKTSTSNKKTRILTDSAWIKNNIVFRKDIIAGSEYWKFMQQLFKYVKGVKTDQHDDAIDSLSLFCRWTNELGLNSTRQIDESRKWESIPVKHLYL